jgi:hypothetical protein
VPILMSIQHSTVHGGTRYDRGRIGKLKTSFDSAMMTTDQYCRRTGPM